MDGRMKIYTIKDVARLAGVSVTTVSRVLNHRPDVNRETREKVERVMAECHFVGNANARSMRQADAELVALIIRGRDNPFLSALAEAILRCGESASATFLAEYIDEKDDEFQTALRLFQEKRVSGFIFVGSSIDERSRVLDSVDVPIVFVTVCARDTHLARASSVSVDDRAMGCAVMQALLSRGHRKIAIFGGKGIVSDGLALRFAGVLDACRESGVPFDERRFVDTRFTIRDAYDAAMRFFPEQPDTTAVFCMGDMVALGVMRALYDLGMRVPDDVSVFGFDGTDLSRFSIPRLSTVEQPVQDLAEKTIAVLMRMLSGAAVPSHVTVPATLHIRESIR